MSPKGQGRNLAARHNRHKRIGLYLHTCIIIRHICSCRLNSYFLTFFVLVLIFTTLILFLKDNAKCFHLLPFLRASLFLHLLCLSISFSIFPLSAVYYHSAPSHSLSLHSHFSFKSIYLELTWLFLLAVATVSPLLLGLFRQRCISCCWRSQVCLT